MTDRFSTHGPIEDAHRETMNKIGAVLDDVFRGYGFALLVFEFDTTNGRMNYLSNANRPDMVRAMREFIDNHNGDKA